MPTALAPAERAKAELTIVRPVISFHRAYKYIAHTAYVYVNVADDFNTRTSSRSTRRFTQAGRASALAVNPPHDYKYKTLIDG